MENQETKRKKVETVLTGEVLSSKSDKTVSVSVERIFQHPTYKKIVRKKIKYLVHDEHNRCKPGDIVSIRLVRPISKRKRWLVMDIVQSSLVKNEIREVSQ
ncbi:MAG: 30S ribosomal protein S17 [Candidatus Omnitrophota bacterium]